MADLRTRLSTWFDDPAARRLARVAPAALLAGGVGVTLGAVIGLPAFAASGLGIVLGNIAANLTSALIQPILEAVDDDARADAIAHGLTQNDPDVAALAAAALAYAGPELTQALPDATRTDLIAALERGMRDAGGPLAVIAPRYAAALRDPQADWAAVQIELRRMIADIHLVAKVGDQGTISGLKQRVENPTGTTKVEAIGGHAARLENVEQIVANTRPQPAAAPTLTCPDCGTSVRAGQRACARCGLPLPGIGAADLLIDGAVPDNEEIRFKRLLLREKQRRLEQLELQNARKGHSTEPEIVTELEDLKKEIAELKKQI